MPRPIIDPTFRRIVIQLGASELAKLDEVSRADGVKASRAGLVRWVIEHYRPGQNCQLAQPPAIMPSVPSPVPTGKPSPPVGYVGPVQSLKRK